MNAREEDRHDRPARSPAPPPRASATLLLCLAIASPFAHAAERDLGAHEHGVATLDVVLDGTRLYLDLESPADNVLGFEHAPSTDAQRTRVAEARAVLDADGLFVPDAAADCVFEESTVHIAFPGGTDGDGEARPDAEHDTGGRPEANDGHEDAPGATGHADIVLGHVLACANPDALRALRTTLFDRFGGFAEIAVRLVGPGGQDGARMTPDDPLVSLEPIL